jgi:hypothetical protein
MKAAGPTEQSGGVESAPHFRDDAGPDKAQAWEEIEAGRYMPRRIRGSYKGRALG